MKNYARDNSKIIQIKSSEYDKFCTKLESEVPNIATLDVFKDQDICDLVKNMCGHIFFKEIKAITSLLEDENIGISAVDIPESSIYSKESDAIYGAAVVIGLFNNFAYSNTDQINGMPFTLHTASHSNGKRLDAAGFDGYTPEVKLGFHNDGLLSSDGIEIPNHIAVYNLYISYHRPGNFIWIPTSAWEDSEKYSAELNGQNIKVKIKLTPTFRLDDKNEVISSGFNYVTVPVSHVTADGEQRFFLNGQVLSEDNLQVHVDFVQSIRDSLQKNRTKIYIQQKERRAIFLKNTKGFHARDIFEEPIEGVDLSRVMLRLVDINAESYPSTHMA
jgi:hypothetical protein